MNSSPFHFDGVPTSGAIQPTLEKGRVLSEISMAIGD